MNTPRNLRVIVVSGTPGTGKTSVSKLLANQMGAGYLSLNQLAQEKRLHRTADLQRQTRILDLKKTRSSLASLARTMRLSIIVDTHIAEAIPKEYVNQVFVLRCHPEFLEDRLRRKGWGTSKIRENVLAEILDSCYSAAVTYYGTRKVAQIDTTELTPGRCARLAGKIITKQQRRPVRIDWLTVLQREGTLEKYLR